MSMSGDKRNLSREALLDEIERLERELAKAINLNVDIHAFWMSSEAQSAAMREALEDAVMVMEYYITNNSAPLVKSKAALATNAGRKVLDVVEAAEIYAHWMNNPDINDDIKGDHLMARLSQALAAMGK